MYCMRCGCEIINPAKFCSECGASASIQTPIQSPMNVAPAKRRGIFWLLRLVAIAVTISFGILFAFGFIGAMLNSKPSSSGSAGSTFDRSSDYTIRVGGTNGVPFHGNYMLIDGSGNSDSRSVEGRAPATYSVHGMMVSVSFQKQQERGELTVSIEKGGQTLKAAQTQAAYGVVTAVSR